MRIRFACGRCEGTVASGDVELPVEIACPRCGQSAAFGTAAGTSGHLERCPACGGPHLFIQKEFPRRVGLAIVTVGAAVFLVLMGFDRIVLGFGALFVVALFDLVIYRASPLMTVCYHCSSEFRRSAVNPRHAGYDPKIGFYAAKKASAGSTPPDQVRAAGLPVAGSSAKKTGG